MKRKEELSNFIKKRLEVFLELFNAGKIDEHSLDHGHDEELIKLLDTVVIKLEDGTEEDFALLEQEYQDSIRYKTNQQNRLEGKDRKDVEEVIPLKDGETVNLTTQDDVVMQEDTPVVSKEEEKKTNGEDKMDEDKIDDDEDDGEVKCEEKNGKDNEEGEDKAEENESSEKNEDKEDDEVKETDDGEVKPEETDANEGEVKAKEKKKKEPSEKRKRSYSGSSSSSSSSSSSDSEDEKKDDEPEVKDKEPEPIEVKPKQEEKPRPRYIYKTTSICLRNLAPTITKQEIVAMCSRYDGFLRLALAEPQPERRWLRRGWLTFKRDANIKEICWHFNNIRLRDFDLGAIINKDLSKRIRYVSGITGHKQVVRSDIRIAAKIVLHLDQKAQLWSDSTEKQEENFGLVSNNPVLHNITDYLIEECSAEEEELLGLEPTADSSDASAVVERDNELIKVLDRIVMYLRIVHSIDYYNHSEYPSEDEMPSRCGLLHARGPAPNSKADISQYIGAAVESKMANYLPEKPAKEEQVKNEAKLVSLSLKDVDTEMDKFVQANTRELAKDKWLCPLSGKKFKGPDFVRKHIFNKHAEKIDEVKKEVEFFNNYLRDPKRPMLPEPQQPKREEPPPFAHQSFRNYGGAYGGGYGGYGGPSRYNMYPQRQRGFAPRSRGGGGGGGGMDHRPVVHYRDLDAPREPEEFI